MTEFCKICSLKFNDSPFVICDNCIDLENAILTLLRQKLNKEFENKLRKFLKDIRKY